MIKFFILWVLLTGSISIFMYIMSVGTKIETKRWTRRLSAVGIAVAIILTVVTFLEGNL
jgi:hypothetical protein